MINSNISSFVISTSFVCDLAVTKSNSNAPSSGGRDVWPPKLSEEEPGQQKAHDCISLRDPERYKLIVKNNLKWDTKAHIQVDHLLFQLLKTPSNSLLQYKGLIQHHIAMRTALFFQQAILCWDIKSLHFEIDETKGQIFSAPLLKITTGAESDEREYNAAHHNTIPQLKARRIGTNIDLKVLKGPQDDSTIALPSFVNKIDTLIDGHSSSTVGLRYKTITLINQLAQDETNPILATQQFLSDFKQSLIKRPQEAKISDQVQLQVIAIYQEQVDKMNGLASVPQSILGRHPFFDPLLDINVSQDVKKDIAMIRKIVTEPKLKVLREGQLAERKILALLDRRTYASRHKIKLSLTYAAKGDHNLKIALEKLFCISVSAIEANYQLATTLNKRYKKLKVDLEPLMQKIGQIITHFQKIEQSYQAWLLKNFRERLRKLTQEELTSIYKETILQEIALKKKKSISNQETIQQLEEMHAELNPICQLENITESSEINSKVFSHLQISIIAKALEINPHHFFCSLFASRLE